MGCSLPRGGEPGEVGEGHFFWECTGATDPVCENELDPDNSFPSSAIAVGATFGVNFIRFSGDLPTIRIEPASRDMLTQIGGADAFRAMKAGDVALLAINGDVVIDMTHVRLDQPDRLDIQLDGSLLADGAAIEILELDDIVLRVDAVDLFGEPLAGALGVKWTTEDDDIIALQSAPTDNDMQLEGVGGGTATLTVEMGDLSADITIVVEGLPQ